MQKRGRKKFKYVRGERTHGTNYKNSTLDQMNSYGYQFTHEAQWKHQTTGNIGPKEFCGLDRFIGHNVLYESLNISPGSILAISISKGLLHNYPSGILTYWFL